MNGTLAHNLRRKLLPALEESHGVAGTYQRGRSLRRMTMIPAPPDWIVADEDRGAALEQFTEISFLVAADTWRAAGLGEPEQGDRYTATLADGRERCYALLMHQGLRPWSLDATGTHYVLRMKWVQG